MGNVVKLVFTFNERFWERAFADSDELGFLLTPDESFQGWWTGLPGVCPGAGGLGGRPRPPTPLLA